MGKPTECESSGQEGAGTDIGGGGECDSDTVSRPADDRFAFPSPEELAESRGRLQRGGGGSTISGNTKPSGPTPEELFTLDYAFRDAGGREGAIALAGLLTKSDQRLAGVVKDFHGLAPSKRVTQPRLLETLAEDNDLDPAEFLGLCVMAMYRYQFDAARVTASLHFEQIVEASVQRAMSPSSGFRDTKLLMEHMRFLPEKGALVNLQVNQQGGVSQLPDFKNLAEIALQASRQALPAFVEGEIVDENTDFEDGSEEGALVNAADGS